MLVATLCLFVGLGCAEPTATPAPVPQAEAAPEMDVPPRDNTLPRASPNASVGQTIGVTEVDVTYARPSQRGRTLYGELVPYGEVWRTGANEATVFTTSTDLMVEGQALPAGTYSLFTIPGEDTWTVIFNETAEQWGDYEYDEAEDALRVEVEPETDEAAEMLTLSFTDVTDDEAVFHIHWGDVRVPVRLAADTEAIMLERGEASVAEATTWQAPYQYAAYAVRDSIHLDAAQSWLARSIEMDRNPTNVRMLAMLHAKRGEWAEAVSTGEEALDLARAQDSEPNWVSSLEEQVAQWRERS